MRVFALAALLAAAPASAQELTIAASPAATSLALGGEFVLAVAVSAPSSSAPAPRLPPMADFDVYEAGRSQSMSFVNGTVSSGANYSFVLRPRRAGRLVVPPISVESGGKTAATGPIEIEVLPPGTAAPARPAPRAPDEPAAPAGERRPAVFVEATLDKPRVFVNEQATLTVRFYTATTLLGSPSYEPPALSGVIAEDLPPERHGTASFGGHVYHYSEIKTALFPVQAGRASIGAATVACRIPQQTGGDPFASDFFDRFFSAATTRVVRLQSQPLSLQADPLPAGKPAGFSGAVGRFTLAATLDRTKVKAGESATLSVVVTGKGNLKSVPEPARPDLPQVRFFEAESSFTADKSADKAGGSKTFRVVLVPRVSGRVVLPPVSLSYYDPERKDYATARSEPLTLEVAPGDPGAAPYAAGPAPAAAPGVTVVSEDIRYLKPLPSRAPASDALAAFAGLGPLHALPFAALLAALAADWRRRRREADPRGARFRGARARADERLARAAALADAEPARAAALVGEALVGYVADKLDASAAGLTLRAALDGLRALPGAPSADSAARLKAAWEEVELSRYAPSSANAEDARRAARATSALLETLDQELRA